MDPVANITEQREIAAWLAQRDEPEYLIGTRLADWLEKAARLAELVLALDEWRRSGGFDPYGASHA